MVCIKKDVMCVEANLDLDDFISDYQVKMIKYNNIKNLLNFNIEMTLDNTQIKYDINNLISIKDFLKNFYYEEVRNKILKGVKNGIENLEKYLLKKENIMLDLNYIFVNIDKYVREKEISIYFIYLPMKESFFKDDFLKKVIEIEDQILGYIEVVSNKNEIGKNKKKDNNEIKQILNNDEYNKVKALEKLFEEDDYKNEKELQFNNKLKDINKTKIIIICLTIAGLMVFKNNMLATIITLIMGSLLYLLMAFFVKAIEQKEYEYEFGEETLVIQKYPYIRKSILDEKIYINSSKFFIGKNKEANLNIPNGLISKKHAVILKKEYGYSIKDLNSTNCTYVNDEKIENGEERLLSNGDKIKFANEVYQFIYDN